MFTDGIGIGMDNNIVTAHQFDFGGEIGIINYFLTGTYSRNYGLIRSVGFTSRQDQYSLLLQTSVNVKAIIDQNLF